MKPRPILTITLNPALDLTGNLAELNPGHVNVMQSGHLHPAGKGINVARVLKDLGAQLRVSGFLGADNAAPFQALFADYGFDDRFAVIPGATRINVKLVEQNARVTELNFPGVNVTPQSTHAFTELLPALASDVRYVVLAGSLPRGVSSALLRQWLGLLTQAGKKVLFDSSAEAFAEGLKASPWLIKPNQHELADWAGEPLESQAALMAAAEALQASHGIEHVVVSRGADGVLWLAGEQWWQAAAPRMEVVSTVGAGDSMVAGFAWGLSQHLGTEQTLRLACAVSALAVTQIGVGVTDQQKLANLMSNVKIASIR